MGASPPNPRANFYGLQCALMAYTPSSTSQAIKIGKTAFTMTSKDSFIRASDCNGARIYGCELKRQVVLAVYFLLGQQVVGFLGAFKPCFTLA